MTFSWYGGTYSFGLKEYELHYVLAGGREQVISGITTNSVTTELTRDGVCQWWVVAINGDGSQSATASRRSSCWTPRRRAGIPTGKRAPA